MDKRVRFSIMIDLIYAYDYGNNTFIKSIELVRMI
jgi:hypothetical protein